MQRLTWTLSDDGTTPLKKASQFLLLSNKTSSASLPGRAAPVRVNWPSVQEAPVTRDLALWLWWPRSGASDSAGNVSHFQ